MVGWTWTSADVGEEETALTGETASDVLEPTGSSYSQPAGRAGSVIRVTGLGSLGSVGATLSIVTQVAGVPRFPGDVGRIEPGSGLPSRMR